MLKVVIREGFDDIEVIIKCPEVTNEIRLIESMLNGCGQQIRLPCTLDGVTLAKRRMRSKLFSTFLYAVGL